MIAYGRGTIDEVTENSIVIDTGSMGYNIFVSARDAQLLSGVREEVRIYTYLQVREDAMQLFGFSSKDDLAVFRLLIGVNGVGPKAALGVLSALTANDLRFAVLAGDAKAIAKAPGIGNKTAQKMILELKDKFDLQDTFESSLQGAAQVPASGAGKQNTDDAVQALVALGYSAADALKAVRSAAVTENMNTEDILKAALKKMAF